ncbi:MULTISPECIES: bifunctional glycosyltransferase/CDP-glycerol:glycerophosphate glycerophosphotransferase [Streptomyces]|uniref:CDP-glycerol glycerophosphotransferase family protein n=1 Tax=Streptomyces mutomycini TaxID=284036 RepID=A0ABW0AZP5_9ACTN|nr:MULTISPECIES: CDP-glycerol glycerophosphotransferase family protein [Streptomyces]KPC82571.1 CDP-glycerol:glycerophosphate glycerophosphotransferase [Streptomyces sp. NRRL S-4]
MSTPDFSCVITAAEGGEEALAASVASVLDQSMRAVETLVVLPAGASAALRKAAGALEGRSPDNVLVLQPGSDSVASLRNAGLDAARGTYVLVLDVGERLQRHACRNLWQAGERTRADLVAGRWSRLTGDGTKEREPSWQHPLFLRSRTVARFTEAPGLAVHDALVTGFCLRRAALERHALRYDEDLTHSGVLFGPLAAAVVGRIALVRRRIVSGRAVPDAGRDLAGVVEAHRRVCHVLVAQGLAELREERDRAFLLDTVVPLVRTFPELPAAERDRITATAARVLPGCVPEPVLLGLPPVERVGVRLLERGDADGVLSAAYALRRRGAVAAPLSVADDGRVYWQGGPDPVLDVTGLGHQYRSFGELKLMNRLTRYEAGGGRVLLAGRLVLPAHTGPDPEGPLTAHLEFRVRDGSRAFRAPVDTLRPDATGISWSTRTDLTRLLRPLGPRDTVWDARMVVEDGRTRSVSDLFAAHDLVGPADTSPALPRLGRAAGDTWQPYVTLRDHLALRLEARRRPARTARRLVHYATHFRPARRARLLSRALRRRWDRLHARGFKVSVYRTWLLRLPVRRGSVVFESHMGTCYGDSPRAVHEEVRARGLRLRCVWSYADSPDGFPADAALVRRWSWRYLWALARAEYWVDNQGFPQHLDKPSGTTYLQTWHGSAYKRMGFDETRVRMQNAPQRERLQQAVNRFDHFLVRSEHDERTLARAYRLPGETLLRTGYPRNDVLLAARARDEAEGRLPRPPLAAVLGLPDHRKVVLYAPTFRGGPGKRKRQRLPLDAARFAERFGDTYTLLVRAHYLEAASLPACPPGTVVDVSGHHDVSELLALTDVLVTDYSSIMFDYALLDRPIVLFAPDLDAYAAERGSYFDLREKAPGPVTATEEELFAVLSRLKTADTGFQEQRAAFAAEFGHYDRGDAARAVVDTVFARHTAPSRTVPTGEAGR